MSDEGERARAVAAVLRDRAERIEAERVLEDRRRRRAKARRGVLGVAWAGVAYVWLAEPAWLRIPPPPPPTVAAEVRALRVNVFLQAQRIEDYRLRRGRLPWVLQEAGPPLPGVEYRRRDNRSYELFGTGDRVRVRYGSERPSSEFAGPAASTLLARAPARAETFGGPEPGGAP